MRALAIPLLALLATAEAQAQDWSGDHVGLGVSPADGQQETPFIYPMQGTPLSAFAGYSWQSGNLVVGGELAIHTDDVVLTEFPMIEYNNLIDLKARVGYSFGRALVYATLGRSQSRYELPKYAETIKGWSRGFGADVMVSDTVSLGAEYLRRDMDFTSNDNTNELSTVTLRLGVRF